MTWSCLHGPAAQQWASPALEVIALSCSLQFPVCSVVHSLHTRALFRLQLSTRGRQLCVPLSSLHKMWGSIVFTEFIVCFYVRSVYAYIMGYYHLLCRNGLLCVSCCNFASTFPPGFYVHFLMTLLSHKRKHCFFYKIMADCHESEESKCPVRYESV